jgi:hypothetical protein
MTMTIYGWSTGRTAPSGKVRRASRRPRRPLAVSVAALLILLVGCSEQLQGSPSPGDAPANQSTTEQTTEAATTSSPPAGNAGIAGLQPCELVDGAALSALDLTSGVQKTVGGIRVCRYQLDGATLNETFTVSVELFDNQGLANLSAENVQSLPDIGTHEAASFSDATGTCGVSLGVGAASRVDNTAVGGDHGLGCEVAARLAAVVEPKLP